MSYFWDRVDTSGDCWLWTGAKRNAGGYGQIVVDGRRVMTHRFAYELEYGPIPAGMVVMHSCDNPPCVRPTHLSLGSRSDNNQDRARKGRSATGDRHGFRLRPDLIPRGAQNGKAKLTEVAVVEIRNSELSVRALASIHGVSEDTVSRIRAGTYRAWRHV